MARSSTALTLILPSTLVRVDSFKLASIVSLIILTATEPPTARLVAPVETATPATIFVIDPVRLAEISRLLTPVIFEFETLALVWPLIMLRPNAPPNDFAPPEVSAADLPIATEPAILESPVVFNAETLIFFAVAFNSIGELIKALTLSSTIVIDAATDAAKPSTAFLTSESLAFEPASLAAFEPPVRCSFVPCFLSTDDCLSVQESPKLLAANGLS